MVIFTAPLLSSYGADDLSRVRVNPMVFRSELKETSVINMKASVIELMVIILLGLLLIFEQGHALQGQ